MKPHGNRMLPRPRELIVTGPWLRESEAPDLLRLRRERRPTLSVLRHASPISG